MKKSYTITIAVVSVIVIIVAWYLISPLFLDKVVDEEIIDSNQEGSIITQSTFQDADDFHMTSGTAKIVEMEGKRYLVLENFETTNGPDLFVYLSNDKGASEIVNLGSLKGNIGNQQYEIPEDVNLEEYNYVLIWCRAFSTLFGSAELN